MVLVDPPENLSLLEDISPFPADVEFVISALEAGPAPEIDRHQARRFSYRVRALLKLFSDPAGAPPARIYTRNVSTQALGFLSDHKLTLSHGGILRILAPTGKVLRIAATVLRCREAAPGWYEGAVYFNRAQGAFVEEA